MWKYLYYWSLFLIDNCKIIDFFFKLEFEVWYIGRDFFLNMI